MNPRISAKRIVPMVSRPPPRRIWSADFAEVILETTCGGRKRERVSVRLGLKNCKEIVF